jgi:hypothetical protein
LITPACPLFIAVERFGPDAGETWAKYVDWAHLPQVRELVSLDNALCPTVLPDILDEDWPHLDPEDGPPMFTSVDYLKSRLGGVAGYRLLCVFRNPPSAIELPPALSVFAFRGYDLVEEGGGISALVNCGGFPAAFANAELNSYGLVHSLGRAVEIQDALRLHYPDEHHACCDVWAIFEAAPQQT